MGGTVTQDDLDRERRRQEKPPRPTSQFLEVPMREEISPDKQPKAEHFFCLRFRFDAADTSSEAKDRRTIERSMSWLGGGRALNWDGSPYSPVAWPDHERDVAVLSRDLPDWKFELDILAANGDDVPIVSTAFWDGRVFNGRVGEAGNVLGWSEARSPRPWEPPGPKPIPEV